MSRCAIGTPAPWRTGGSASGYAPSDDLLRRAPGARRRALRQAVRLLQGRPERDGHHRPARGPGWTARAAPGRPRPSPPARQGHVPEDRPDGRLMKLVVHVDGGARGNPGPAAVAAVATTPDGEP